MKNINHVRDLVNTIDVEKKRILLKDKQSLKYDFLILSPGISFKWNNLAELKDDKSILPHCWDGDKNLIDFKKKIDGLDDKSNIIISSPDYPYRCPPAPYERASLIAHYLKKKRKNFKIIILDSKDSFTKKDLFFHEWKTYYKDHIEWIGRSDGGQIQSVNSKTKTVTTNSGLKLKADLIHIIPNQAASKLFFDSRLIKKNWCEVNPINFELKGFKDIYAIGDSIDAWDMPKSAFAANSQSKILARNLINKIFGKEYISPVFLNTCYSFSTPNRAFSISSWYRLNSDKDRIVSLGSNESNINASKEERIKETLQAYGWYQSLIKEIYG